ncbi:unnamed protein product [Cuscuta epithymum]|uniref:Helitron helicase-like domain-containing protein n=1 Tax=Cuscuta epithymum TaxID=186058 RepID=A0AAV0ENB9_9ASTE|nr:unnamed protein product [Cuscuta epithymum]
MIHGPCGVINPQCPCMVLSHGSTDPKCRSKYPHTFSPLTVFDEDCFPSYRRRDTGITVEVRKHKLDNRWIVPYNSHLLRKFDCHINVEVCASVRSVKYIYKYVYKGHDRVSMSLSESGEEGLIDEISDFQKARWVSAPEAAWRIFSFPISQMRPAVLQLQVHLENAHYLTFYGNQRITYITGAMDSMKTMLTQFFAMNASDHVAKSLHLLYVEFPHYFVWNNQRKQWTQRKRKEVIGRLVTVNPMEGERYYLRLLLSNVRGPTSFVDLKSVGSDAMATYRAAAERLGLLSGFSLNLGTPPPLEYDLVLPGDHFPVYVESAMPNCSYRQLFRAASFLYMPGKIAEVIPFAYSVSFAIATINSYIRFVIYCRRHVLYF